MATVLTDDQHYTNIANSIRAKNGTANTYTPAQMSAAIDAISGGGSTLGTKTITTNGTYAATDDSLDGYSSVTVNVAGGSSDFPASDLVGVGRATPPMVSGVNLLDPDTRASAYMQDGLSTAFVGDYVTLAGKYTRDRDNVLWWYGSSNSGVILPAGTYTITWYGDELPSGLNVQAVYDYSASIGYATIAGSQTSVTFTCESEVNCIRFFTAQSLYNTTVNISGRVMVESGTVSSGKYEPYEEPLAYITDTPSLDVVHNGVVSSVDIDLPTRGWVGSLPNGVADTMTLDGSGNVTWTLNVGVTTTAVTDGITGTVGTDIYSSTGVLEDGATVLYPLATPTTETDTVTLPSISSGDYVQLVGLPTRQTATV